MKNRRLQHRQFLFYCVIGGSGTALTCVLYALLVQSVGLGVQAANAVGYVAGTLLSFVLNARFNFLVADRIARRLAAFFTVAFFGWLASAGLLYLFVGLWKWNAIYAYAIIIFVVVLLQYNLNRLVSFSKTGN